MVLACWSSKGGSGTTVVACGLVLLAARSAPALMVDLVGDASAVLGLADQEGPGWRDWMAAGPDVPGDRLAAIEVEVAPGVRLLAPGPAADSAGPRTDLAPRPGPPGESEHPAPHPAARGSQLAVALGADARRVIADCGLLEHPAALAVARSAPAGLLVLRPCYLALRRALLMPVRPTGVVLVRERERALTSTDVEDVLGVPVRAQVDIDPAVARCVDAGLMARRMPRTLERGLRGAA